MMNTTRQQIPLLSPQNTKKERIKKKRNIITKTQIQYNQSGPIERLTTPYYLKKSQETLSINSTMTKTQRLNKLEISQNNENENINVSSWTNFEYNKLFPTSYKYSNYKLNPNLNKTQSKKAAVKLFSLPKNGRNIITIHIETNWGNTNDIRMHFIAIFDKYNRQK